ncbi:uncharacterized protein LOC100707911 isoform X3 [Anopheles sinensis]|uniref:Uncharacterized protein LOC100707911 isoform X3 n=1 Tax=Anopheles sinensis TaxID=74873 RepID=A0A084WA25_ANOSI|nr:uncharacterized protein LOC100707911 isoform X3 [Anopheles sinensis]
MPPTMPFNRWNVATAKWPPLERPIRQHVAVKRFITGLIRAAQLHPASPLRRPSKWFAPGVTSCRPQLTPATTPCPEGHTRTEGSLRK